MMKVTDKQARMVIAITETVLDVLGDPNITVGREKSFGEFLTILENNWFLMDGTIRSHVTTTTYVTTLLIGQAALKVRMI